MMTTDDMKIAQQACENLLLEGKRYNIEHGILPGENAIADRLLARGVELRQVYKELHAKLDERPPALQAFLGLVLSAADVWSPEKNQAARAAREELVKVNRKIAKQAAELSRLLDQRSDLHNTSGFSSDTHYHVCGVIEAAAKQNHLFQTYVQERLDALTGQFDLKYWPSLSMFAQALADDAEDAVVTATDPITAAATSIRSSQADFFKALFALMKENSARNYGHLPGGFELSDQTLAALATCALNLDRDDEVSPEFVKRFRQRERESLQATKKV